MMVKMVRFLCVMHQTVQNKIMQNRPCKRDKSIFFFKKENEGRNREEPFEKKKKKKKKCSCNKEREKVLNLFIYS